jgi:phytanoyl-CoA hydroxylase
LTYMIYNLFQRRKLKHNERLYKLLGLRKKYFSPISSADFANCEPSKINKIVHTLPTESTTLFKELDADSQESIRKFDEEGYVIIKRYLDKETVSSVNAEIAELLKSGKVKFRYKNKIMFAIHQSELLYKIGHNEKLMELLNSLVGDEMKLFQSINFIMGSEQRTHSDSIHMTTYPLGGLLGVWIALDDVDEDNGPLHYYPGSHKLPYYLNEDYDNEGNALMIGNKDYSAYEAMIAQKLEDQKENKKIFKAKKGDLLIWHANLFHGGEPHTNKSKTRRSMVLHYYSANRICYHEISQRPALMS